MAGVGVKVGKLRVGAKATTGMVDALDLGAQDALRRICFRWICHGDRGRRAQGTEGSRRQPGLRRYRGRRTHRRDVPPEVTTGRDLVLVGRDVVVRGEVGEPGAEGVWAGTVLEGALAPGCSLATTTPMAMVAPLATSAAKRVRRRSRVSARCLLSGKLDCGVELTGRVLGSVSVQGSRGA